MRRALIGTLAGCLASAACVLGQTPLPPGSPYTQYTRNGGAPNYDGPPIPEDRRGEETRRQTMYRPNGPMPDERGYYRDDRYPRDERGPVRDDRYPVDERGPARGDQYPRGPVRDDRYPAGERVRADQYPRDPRGPTRDDRYYRDDRPYVRGDVPPVRMDPPMSNEVLPAPMAPPTMYGEGRPMNGAFMDSMNRHPSFGYAPNCDWGCGPQGGMNCRCPNGVCGPPGRAWVSGEFLLWWMNGQYVPALATTSPAGTPLNNGDPANPVPIAGALGLATTNIAFGNARIGNDVRPGFRARAGMWLDDCQMFGVEGSFFFLNTAQNHVIDCCFPNAILMRPFFNARTNLNDAEIVCFPGILAGTLKIDTRTDVYGADVNLRRALCCGCNFRVDLLGGYRFMSLADVVNITECLYAVNTAPGAGAPVGTQIIVNDRFATQNNFHGGQIGLTGEIRSGRAFLDFRTSIALGASVQNAQISGSTTTTTPDRANPLVGAGVPVVQRGGLLTQSSNIGNYSYTDFGVIPEVGLNLGLQASDHLRLWVGYSFLYWSNIARAGEQIDLRVNDDLIPPPVQPIRGPNLPAFPARRGELWLHGVSFGAQFRY